eukprot:gene22867-biopygen13332
MYTRRRPFRPFLLLHGGGTAAAAGRRGGGGGGGGAAGGDGGGCARAQRQGAPALSLSTCARQTNLCARMERGCTLDASAGSFAFPGLNPLNLNPYFAGQRSTPLNPGVEPLNPICFGGGTLLNPFGG